MPSITFWTRLEPFTRLDDISLGLQAQIADPVWMLARQWQNGEYQAEDSGVPVQVRVQVEHNPLARYYPGPLAGRRILPGQLYLGELPLEALVEREVVQRMEDPRRDLRLAAEAGLYFLRLLQSLGVTGPVRNAFIKAPEYKLAVPIVDAAAGQDPSGQAYLSVMSGRVPDGLLLYTTLKETLRPSPAGAPTLPSVPAIPESEREKVIQAGLAYLDWFESLYSVPSPEAVTWNSQRMEYSFAVSASTTTSEIALEASEYHGGALDWYSFDLAAGVRLDVQSTDPQPEVIPHTIIPTSLRFPGMAADRWWEFEGGQVNFSRIEGSPDELMRLLLIHFGSVYSNDWYIFPLELSPGALYRHQSLVVVDAFGEETLVQHYSALDPSPREWRVFALHSGIPHATDPLLFLPPVLAASLHSDPIEEVFFLRDELANLVWAVEYRVPGLSGTPLNRYEQYHQRKAQSTEPPSPAAPAGELDYLLATSTPDHWIPFQAVRLHPDRPDVRLVRAAALLNSEDGQPTFAQPLGRILEPETENLSLFEEEVPRSGIRLVRQFQYTRWVDGSTVLWLARHKGPGRGESSAGLHYDQVA